MVAPGVDVPYTSQSADGENPRTRSKSLGESGSVWEGPRQCRVQIFRPHIRGTVKQVPSTRLPVYQERGP